MIGFIELSWFQKTLKYKQECSKLRVLLFQLFDERDTMNTVFTIKRDVDIDPSLFVSQFYDWALGALNRLDGRTDASSD